MSTPTIVDTEIPAELDWDMTCEACEENAVDVLRRLACGCTQMRCHFCHLVFIAGLHLWERLYKTTEWRHEPIGNDAGCAAVTPLKTGPVVPQIIVAEICL